MRLKGKVAIVTGAGTGLGRAIALMYGREGAAVVVNGRRSGPIEATARVITDAGGRAMAVPGDMTDAICPAFVETEINRDFLAGLRRSGGYEALVKRHPLGFLGEPDDVAYAAVYLASDEARWVTGIALPLDGGMTAGTA